MTERGRHTVVKDDMLDLVVVGCGAGGLATATEFLEAHPTGRVVVLERTNESARGGNTAWTGAFFRRESRPSALPTGRADPYSAAAR